MSELTATARERHYIGLTPMGRLHMTLTADNAAEFTTSPTEPVRSGDGGWLYPVPADVAEEWDSRDDESENDGEVSA